MAEPTILIKFKAEDKGLVKKINKLANAQAKFNKTIKATIPSTTKASKSLGVLSTRGKRLAKTNGALSLSFATLRSKLLLFSFAMSMGGRQLAKFGKESAKLESMERAFTTLSGGASDASVSIDKLKDATDGTVSEFDLFQQANNAMILGVSKNSDEMAEMFDMAQRLGRALGRDTKSSVESLITGIGRQSRMMLDNIGIVVKSDKAYKAYAKELKKSVDDLTEAERKQAFLNATMEAAREKISRLGGEVPGTVDAFDALSASMENLQARTGKAINEVFVPFMELMTALADSIDTEEIKSYGVGVGVAAVAFVALRVAIDATGVALLRLRAAMIASGVGIIAVVVGSLAGALLDLSNVFKETEEEADDYGDAIKKANDKTKAFFDTLDARTARELTSELDNLKKKLGELTAEGKTDALVNKNLADGLENLKSKAIAAQGTINMLNAKKKEYASMLKQGIIHQASYNKKIADMSENLEAAKSVVDKYEKSQAKLDKKTTEFFENMFAYNKETGEMIDQSENRLDTQADLIAQTKEEIKILEEQIAKLKGTAGSYDNLTEAQERAGKMYGKTTKGQKEAIEAQIIWVKENQKAFGSSENFLAVLGQLEDKLNKYKVNIKGLQGMFDKEFNIMPEIRTNIFENVSAAFEKLLFKTGEFKNQWDAEAGKFVPVELEFKADAFWKDLGQFKELTGKFLDTWVFQNRDAVLKREELMTKAETLRKAKEEEVHKDKAARLASINKGFEEGTVEHGNQIVALEKDHNNKMAEIDEEDKERKSNIEIQFNMSRLESLNENLQMVQGMQDTLTAGMKADLDQRINNELKQMKQGAAYQRADADKRENMENSVRKKYAGEQKKVFKMEQASQLASVYFNTSGAIMKSWNMSPETFGLPWTAIAAAMGAMQAQQILSQKPPEYQYGGMVGGSRHAQGGTPITAERGEFVMQRRAVEALGEETMNRINEGGAGGGSVTVNVSGNVMTQDFVEGDLAEAIREASRRGTDFGVS